MTRTMRRSALLLVVLGATALPARADDLTSAANTQKQVNAEIDAIRTSGETPSNTCLVALQDMHTAEQQLTDLTGSSSNAPSGSALAENEQGEVAVGRDVLASDMETAAAACRADGVTACAGTAATKAAKSCATLSHAQP